MSTHKLFASLRLTILATAVAAAFTLTNPLEAEPMISIEPNDRIALVGNTFFDRMRSFGQFETYLHQQFPKHELIVRNLAWSADELKIQPRPKNFPNLTRWLEQTRADVILAAFGFNESFGGAAGLADFRQDLSTTIRNWKSKKFNGESAPRIVLITPIATEAMGSNLPDADAANARLAPYVQAIREIGEAERVPVIDLFTPTRKAMSDPSKTQPLTFNGIHLLDAGYEFVARQMIEQLTGHGPSALNNDLRKAVEDKASKWTIRYRPLNTYYIFGDRKSPYGVVNFPEENTKLEQMLGIRDRAIHAIATGANAATAVDDAQTKELPTITGNRAINEWMTPEQELASFKVDPRFEVNCFASEDDFPELACPIQMRWDAKGRLWVACSTTYPQIKPGDITEPNDKILVLEDVDGDGKADTCEVFADGLHLPLSFEFGDGGLYVSEQPHLTFIKDTNGDGKADFRRIVLTGFGTEDSHHALHDFTWTPDGDLVFREGIFHHSQVETPYGPVRVRESGFFRFRPAEHRLVAFGSYVSTNPWGLTFDQWGQHLGSHPVFATAVHARNAPYPDLHQPAGRFIPAYSGTCGQEFIYNPHFPDELQGHFVRVRYKPTHEIELHKWVEKNSHFVEQKQPSILQATNLSFIPVDVRFGPRGALYVCDWYNPVKGHMQYSLRDTRRDKTSGRIWRITAKDRPLLDPPKIAGQPIAALLELLKAYEYRTRYWAKRELRQHDPSQVEDALTRWVKTLDPNDPRYELHRVEALWMYRNIGKVNTELLGQILQSPNHHARAAATRQLRYWHPHMTAPLNALRKSANDPNGLVRLEAAIAGSYLDSKDAVPPILDLLEHPMDNYLTLALRMSLDALRPHWQPDVAFQQEHHHLLHFIVSSNPKARIPQDKGDHPFDKQHNPKVVRVETVPERMLFTVTEIRAKAGEAVKLVFHNPDVTPHNLVIVAPGASEEIGLAANEMAKTQEGFAKGFVPESPKVLHATKMLNQGQTQILRFLAPKKPGVYPYICSFPGHWLVMKGELIVE